MIVRVIATTTLVRDSGPARRRGGRPLLHNAAVAIEIEFGEG